MLLDRVDSIFGDNVSCVGVGVFWVDVGDFDCIGCSREGCGCFGWFGVVVVWFII